VKNKQKTAQPQKTSSRSVQEARYSPHRRCSFADASLFSIDRRFESYARQVLSTVAIATREIWLPQSRCRNRFIATSLSFLLPPIGRIRQSNGCRSGTVFPIRVEILEIQTSSLQFAICARRYFLSRIYCSMSILLRRKLRTRWRGRSIRGKTNRFRVSTERVDHAIASGGSTT